MPMGIVLLLRKVVATQRFFIFTQKLGEGFQFDDHILLDGVGSTTNQITLVKGGFLFVSWPVNLYPLSNVHPPPHRTIRVSYDHDFWNVIGFPQWGPRLWKTSYISEGCTWAVLGGPGWQEQSIQAEHVLGQVVCHVPWPRWWGENNRNNRGKNTQDHLEHVPTKNMLRIDFLLSIWRWKQKVGKKHNITLKCTKSMLQLLQSDLLIPRNMKVTLTQPCWEGHLWVQTGSPWRTWLRMGVCIYLFGVGNVPDLFKPPLIMGNGFYLPIIHLLSI